MSTKIRDKTEVERKFRTDRNSGVALEDIKHKLKRAVLKIFALYF